MVPAISAAGDPIVHVTLTVAGVALLVRYLDQGFGPPGGPAGDRSAGGPGVPAGGIGCVRSPGHIRLTLLRAGSSARHRPVLADHDRTMQVDRLPLG